jgi:CxxC-x17-CxxC domain-containing protein
VSYADKTLACRDCGQSFTFTVGEQEFFASRGFTNEPSRCPDCRAARKASRGDSSYSSGGYSSGGYSSGGYSSGGGGGYGREREMYSATCSDCGQEARVPFQPRGDKPVYCSDCFSKQRGGGGGGYSRSYR